MRLLLDTCVWGRAREALEVAGHDVIWAGDWKEDPGDEEILARSHREARVLVTLDKDFGELAVIKGYPHSGILRLVGFSAKQQATICALAIKLHGAELEAGAIVTAEPGRFRVRPAEAED